MSFWRREELKPKYQGSEESLATFQNIMQSPGLSFGYTPTIEGLLTQAGLSAQGMGVSPLTSMANQYFSDLLSGKGINPYEAGSPYYQYQQAALQSFQRDVLPQVATQAAAKGLLRGSAAERMTGRATSSLANMLQQQAYGAYQQALQRQFGAAQFVPQQQLAEQQARLSGLLGVAGAYQNLGSLLTNIQQQNIANQLAAAQAINASYGLPAYAPSGISELIGGLGSIAGPAMGLAGALTGNPLLAAAGIGMSGFGNRSAAEQNVQSIMPYNPKYRPIYSGMYPVTYGSVGGF